MNSCGSDLRTGSRPLAAVAGTCAPTGNHTTCASRRRRFPLSLALISVDLWRRWDEVSGSGHRRTKALGGLSVVRSGLLSLFRINRTIVKLQTEIFAFCGELLSDWIVRGLITWTTQSVAVGQRTLSSNSADDGLKTYEWKKGKCDPGLPLTTLCGAVTWSWADRELGMDFKPGTHLSRTRPVNTGK